MQEPILRNVGGQAVPGGGPPLKPLSTVIAQEKYDPDSELAAHLEAERDRLAESRRVYRWADKDRKVENGIDASLVIALPERTITESDKKPRRVVIRESDRNAPEWKEAEFGLRRIRLRSWAEIATLQEAITHIGNDESEHIDNAKVREAARGLIAVRLLESGHLNLADSRERLREGAWLADPFLAFESGQLVGTDLGILGPNDEFTPIINGPFLKQLYLYDMQLAHTRAFEMVNHNPIARQIIALTVNFTLGKGVKVQAANPRVQELWDEFWDNAKMESRLRTWLWDLSWQGELFCRFMPTGSGSLHARELDGSTVWEIVTNPDDIEEVYYYHQQYQTPYQIYTNRGIESQRYIVRQVPAWEVEHIKLNVSSGEKRGRSDLYPLMTWLKRVKDVYNAIVVRIQEEASHSWEVIVHGTDQDAQAIADDPKHQTPPPPGSLFIHNEAVEWRPMSLVAGQVASAARSIGEQLLGIIAVGANFPPEWLSFRGTAATRASALTAAEPATKHLEGRQRLIERLLQSIRDRLEVQWRTHLKLPESEVKRATIRVMMQMVKDMRWTDLVQVLKSIVTGKGLSYMTDVDTTIEITFPEIKTENRKEKMADILTALAAGSMTHRRASNMVNAELSITEYDYDVEMAERKEEEAAGLGLPVQMGGDDIRTPMTDPDDERPPQSGSDEDARRYRDNADEL